MRGVVSLYLALCCGAVPIATLSHLSASDHSHRYCQEHDQIEEFSAPPAVSETSDDQPILPAALHRDPTPDGNQAHLVCQNLNQTVSRAPALDRDATVSVAPTSASTLPPCWRPERSTPCLVLLAAPKTSPPSTTV
jgi:hypothetical protein